MDFKHFVTFVRMGTDKKSDTTQVHSNDISDIIIPNGVVAIITFDEAEKDIYRDGEKIISINDRLNEKIYYIGKVKSLDEIKAEYGEDSTAYKKLVKENCIGAVSTPENFLVPIKSGEKINIVDPRYIGSYGPQYYDLPERED